MDRKVCRILARFYLVGFLFSACAKPKSDEEVKATFVGYWMDHHELQILENAFRENSCPLILEDKKLSLSAETIDLNIISIWPGGSIFALDTLIKKNASKAHAHPDSVTAANIPGRFVDQGILQVIEESDPLKGAIEPSEEDKFVLAPFEKETLGSSDVLITLEELNQFTFTMQSKKSADAKNEGYQSTYTKITLDQYRNMVDFSQACLNERSN